MFLMGSHETNRTGMNSRNSCKISLSSGILSTSTAPSKPWLIGSIKDLKLVEERMITLKQSKKDWILSKNRPFQSLKIFKKEVIA